MLLSIGFILNSNGIASSHFAAYDYSCVDWDGLCDHRNDGLWDVLWDDIFKLGASAVPAEFCECFQFVIDVYIPHRIYQVKPHSFLWFQLLVLLPWPVANTRFQCSWYNVVARFRDTNIAQTAYFSHIWCRRKSLIFICAEMLYPGAYFAWKDLGRDKNCLL